MVRRKQGTARNPTRLKTANGATVGYEAELWAMADAPRPTAEAVS